MRVIIIRSIGREGGVRPHARQVLRMKMPFGFGRCLLIRWSGFFKLKYQKQRTIYSYFFNFQHQGHCS
jgi:hypothetical protein